MTQKNTKKLVLLALFIAIEILLWQVPSLGFIRILAIEITVLHVPVIIASILLGVKEGMILGALFGLFSLITASTTPLPHAFLFSPLAVGGNLFSLIIVFVPRILIGFIPGFIISKLNKPSKISIALTCFITSMIHTVLVIGLILLFFNSGYQRILGVSGNDFTNLIISIITINGGIEAIVATMIGTASILALRRAIK